MWPPLQRTQILRNHFWFFAEAEQSEGVDGTVVPGTNTDGNTNPDKDSKTETNTVQ